ncbi:MAG: succinate dehydrogenase, cytochrome b556 subunit [Hyphomicrobiales bacterium]|nr:succinate dehydrogenase, cytochrome b556 subunit [Hyphomicrobiales bacterium]
MSDVEGRVKRPLSPHLSIYKPIPTMVVSILHRITGGALYVGTLLMVWWLLAAASSEAYFNYINEIMGSIIGQFILIGFTWALIQHMLGGVKHLFWDVGYGFEKVFSSRIAIFTLIGSISITCIIWLAAYAI